MSSVIKSVTTREGLRALAHPTRLDLLDLLRVHSALTASQCGALLGLSPKTCSYHLRVLAGQDLIEPADVQGATGRERHWQRASWENDVPLEDTPTDDPELDEAHGQFMHVRLQHDHRLLQKFVTAHSNSQAGWKPAVTLYSRTVLMSPDELYAWGVEVASITREHVRRAEQQASKVQRPVRLMLYGFPQDMAEERRS
ncbi:helix-turn-helix domain-containing protein [Streptomyces canus]|nr:helix-turn-helix domain-containing protein [Streptomyces canus]